MTILLSFVMLPACSQEDILSEMQNDDDSGMPVEIFALLPGTRDLDENAKREFVTGDLIHVEASFYEDEDGSNLLKRTYKAFQMDANGVWQQVGGKSMFWPNKAEIGVFKAFYVKQFQYILEKLDIPQELKLSDIEDNTDPLMASTKIEWGHRVNLEFSHLCTHLTFSQLDPDISDYFWLIDKKQDIKNVFTMILTTDNEIKYGFETRGDANYNDLAYVQRRSENIYIDNIKTKSKVGFHLAPGDYSNVELRTINNYSYLAYQSEKTSELQANKAYEVDITQQKGITFVQDDEDWEDDEAVIEIFEPEDFLKSIADGKDYEVTDEVTNKPRKVLQSTANGTLLLANVSFKNKDYNKVELPTGRFFDGGNHYISNIATNLFTENRGTIRHLGLRNVDCEVELWYESNQSYYHRWGVICEVNAGIIENIRIENSRVSFKIGVGHDDTANAIFNVGTIAGTSINDITDVSYEGDIIVESSEQTDFNATVNIGGIVGQTNGFISDISPLDDSAKIRVEAKLQGDMGVIYAGGLAGVATTNIQNSSIPYVEVDCSAAKGLVGNVGGLVGRLRGSVGTPSVISSCTVKGSVKGMEVMAFSGFKAYSYTGGFAGYLYNYDVNDCRSLCDVEMKSDVSLDTDILYCVGGGFGRIISINDIVDNYVWGDILRGPDQYIGNFIGIGPVGKEWSDYSGAGNRVKELLSGQYIGMLQDDASPTE